MQIQTNRPIAARTFVARAASAPAPEKNASAAKDNFPRTTQKAQSEESKGLTIGEKFGGMVGAVVGGYAGFRGFTALFSRFLTGADLWWDAGVLALTVAASIILAGAGITLGAKLDKK